MLTSARLGAPPITVFVLAAALSAQPEPVTVKLALAASPACTTREQLMARVRARSDRIRFDDGAPVIVHAELAPAAGTPNVAGELLVERPDGPTTARRLVARSCEQAADGLALILVLALDPGALTAAPGPAPRPPVPPPAPAVATMTAPASPAPVRTGWVVDAGGRAVIGPAPRAMPALALAARVTRDRPGLLSPALGLSLLHAWSGDLIEPGGTATFQLDAAALDACAIRAALRALDLRGCANLLAGRLAAAGSNTYAPASRARPFAAAGASVLLEAALNGHLLLGARLDAGAAWTRDRFAFSPAVFYRAAALTLAAGVSAGVRFP